MNLKPVQSGDEILRKGPWMPEEDEILVEYVRQFGARDWSSIRSKGLLPRTGKSCRLRWVNKLKPDLKRSGCKFSPEEEKLVVEMQAKLGNKWAKIASCLPGRTDNDVKNFWSTRQKRILRALQRPKVPSGCTDASADTSDLSKDPSLSEFGSFQVHSPIGPAAVGVFGPPFIFAEDDAAFSDVSDIRCLRHNLHSYNSMEVDDVLSIKFEHMVAGEIPGNGESQVATTTTSIARGVEGGKPQYFHQQQPLSVTLPSSSCMTMAPRTTTTTTRSIKRRPRSRRDARASSSSSSFEQTISSSCVSDGVDGGGADMGMSLIHNCGRSGLETTFGVSLTESQQNNNYLEFLLQSDGSTMQNAQVFSPELPLFLTNNHHQWEKLPMLYPEDSSLHDYGNKDSDSCSPDSVITNFAGDVFDSLEPLCPTPSEWWVARLS